MHMVAETKDWFKEKGRHEIYAGDRPMNLAPGSRSLPVVEKRNGIPHAGTVQLGKGCSH
jgi:hypothetical protein